VVTECDFEPTPLAGCPFVAKSTHFVLTYGEVQQFPCEWTLEGRMFRDGSSEITGGEILGNVFCKALELKGLPWKNQICKYTGSWPNQYYDRISVDLPRGDEIAAGPIYLHLLTLGKRDAATSLAVKFASAQKFADALKPAEIGKGPWGFLADDESQSTMYEFGSESVIKVTGAEATACPWNFAKLNELP